MSKSTQSQLEAKTTILIAKVILLKNHKTIVKLSLMSGCKGGKWQEETLLTYPTPFPTFS
jgi:hypothetical protein